ncbi:RES domain-containing protein [Aneurinibacillus tyrosinisolvens]|uniref:RES domain-containing protein n=1 Tax=Aneurinibacillus tyrosinisolvens TaxID=1443435 RepID=UPI00063F734F|nr:RES domain-containing protein [Aneurinibacillus tyrosinisolvens]
MCEFEIAEKAKQKKVINLVDGLNQTYDELIEELVKADGKAGMTGRILGKIYLKMIADKIFLPIEAGQEREKEYAPFHAFAYYFQYFGYDGIIFKSTVQEGGKNLVLFDPSDAQPTLDTLRKFRIE